MEKTFYPVEVSYTLKNGKPVVQIFGRDETGKQVTLLDDRYTPHFKVLAKDNDIAEKQLMNLHVERERTVGVVSVEKANMTYKGKTVEVLKAFVERPADVPLLRDAAKSIGTVLEADILFSRRYFLDHDIRPLTKHKVECEEVQEKYRTPTYAVKSITHESDSLDTVRILAFDIETYSSTGKLPVAHRDPIIMVALIGDGFRRVITWKDCEHDDLVVVKDEKELIEAVRDAIVEYGPDVLTGYNSDGYDLPFIKERAEKLGAAFDIGTDYTGLRKNRTTDVLITGIANIDLLTYVRKSVRFSLETPVFTLDSVAKELLGDGKIEVDFQEVFRAWENGDKEQLSKFADYNLQDTDLTYRLAELFLPNIMGMAKLIGLPLSHVYSLSYSQLVEWYLLREAFQSNRIAPSRPGENESISRVRERFEGAFVFEPKPGIYKDIIVFDFLSLYPTIISAHNISPETVNVKECKENSEAVPELSEEYWVCKEPRGFISEMIENIIRTRLKVKEEIKKDPDNKMLQARQLALKLVANATYGYLGFVGARWYSVEAARIITAFGRHHIHDVIEKSKEAGFEVLYSDTDSIFLGLGSKKREEAEKFVDVINESLPGLMELEFDGYYSSGIFVAAKGGGGAKKRYALLTEKGELKIKGFETVRRNASKIARSTQKEVLRILLKEHDAEKATAYVKKIVTELKNHTLPAEELVIQTQLQRDPSQYEAIGPHVAAAKRMQEQGKEVYPGMIVQYIVTAGKGRIRDRVKLPDEVANHVYDSEYYINNQVLPAVESLFDTMHVSIVEEVEDKKQSTLGSFL